MQLKNRIKQNAEIDATGQLILGAEVVGYQAIGDFASGMSDSMPYLLTNADGSEFEFGDYNRTFVDGEGYTYHRTVELSNVGGGAGFPDSTTDLIFSGVIGAVQLVANTGAVPPTARGFDASAVGPDARALHPQSMALGYRVQTVWPGETAMGAGDVGSATSYIGVEATVASSSTDVFKLRAEPATDFVFNNDMLGRSYSTDTLLIGMMRVTGTIVVMDSADFSPNSGNSQVYSVEILLAMDGSVSTMKAAVFTPLLTSPGVGLHSLALNYDKRLELVNDNTDIDLWALGHLCCTRIVTDYLEE